MYVCTCIHVCVWLKAVSSTSYAFFRGLDAIVVIFIILLYVLFIIMNGYKTNIQLASTDQHWGIN